MRRRPRFYNSQASAKPAMPPPTMTASARSTAIIGSGESIEPNRPQQGPNRGQCKRAPRASEAGHQLGMAELPLTWPRARPGAPLQQLDIGEAIGDGLFAI